MQAAITGPLRMNASGEASAGLDTALAHAARLLATDPALAGEQAQEIIKVVGDHPMALLVLGASHRARGDVDTALGILQPLAVAAAEFGHGPAGAGHRAGPCAPGRSGAGRRCAGQSR